MLVSLLILIVTMTMIALQKLPGFHHNRPTGALTGAVLMLLAGELTLDRALASIDLATLALLFGLMVLVAYLEEAGAFTALAAPLIRLGRGPAMTWAVLFASGIVAALFMNDTVCLLFAPLILATCRHQGIDAVPPLTALILGANIGSLMLPIGNPQQAFIAMHSDIAFADYARRMVPIGLACLAVAGLLLHLAHRPAAPS
ncbi:MAG TPA: SLC13 family permease, partial [Mariprofundaceae bacterium]|nr:SLC13 family permease [Mariprofundaceae bacterium]